MKYINSNICFMVNNIGSWIKQGLADIGKNQAWLAEAVGLQTPQISRIISGSSEATPDVLNRIADALRKPRIEAYRAAGHFSEKTNEDPWVEKMNVKLNGIKDPASRALAERVLESLISGPPEVVKPAIDKKAKTA